jgi:HEAT repeat protein
MLAFLAPLLVSALAFSASAPAPVSAPVLGTRADAETDAVLERIYAKGEKADRKLFQELGKRKDADGFNALMEAIEFMREQGSTFSAFNALEHFKGVDPFEERAVKFLVETIQCNEFSDALSAKSVLSKYGEAASKPLEKLARKAKNGRTRALAIGALMPVLIERGDPDSLELIFESYDKLGSGTLENLTEAVAQFKGLKLGRVLKKGLSDKSADTSVLVAVIEGAASIEGEEVSQALVDTMAVKDPAIVIAAIRALQVRGYTEHERALRRHLKSRNTDLRYAATSALASLPDAKAAARSLAALLKGSKSKDPLVRAAVLDGLRDVKHPKALEAVMGFLHDEEFRLRETAIQILLDGRQRAAIPVLIVHLGEEQDAELKGKTLDALRLLAGINHGPSAPRWTRWWQNEGAQFKMPTLEIAQAVDKARRRAEWERKDRYAFFGLKIESKRALFILDASGSMTIENENGITRFEQAQRQLGAALKRFPDGGFFNVIFFGSRVISYGDELIEMNKTSRADVIERVNGQETLGLTALFDALEVGFAQADADTIYLLSDGSPSGGKTDDVDEIRQAVKDWNTLRRPRITIHCISLGRQDGLLRSLADDSGGTYVEIDDNE